MTRPALSPDRLPALLASPVPERRAEATRLLAASGPSAAADLLAAAAAAERQRIRFAQLLIVVVACACLSPLRSLVSALLPAKAPVLLALACYLMPLLGVAAATGLLLLRFASDAGLREVARELGRRGDARAVAPLLSVWNSLARPTLGDDAIEAAVTELLPGFPAPGGAPLTEGQARELRRKVLRLFRVSGREVTPVGEFTDGRADLLVRLMLYLSRTGDPRDRDVVAVVARSRADAPNQRLVRDAAAVCLAEVAEANPSATFPPTIGSRPAPGQHITCGIPGPGNRP